MISAPVRVVSIADGKAQVEATQQSGCGGCASRSACGVSVLGKYFSARRKPVEVACVANVRAGDELELQMSEGDLLRAGLLAYLLPTVMALAWAGIAAAAGLGDVGAALGAGLGLAGGLLLMRLSRWTPRIDIRPNHSSNKGDTP